jgi:hypothetical protein
MNLKLLEVKHPRDAQRAFAQEWIGLRARFIMLLFVMLSYAGGEIPFASVSYLSRSTRIPGEQPEQR